MLAHVFDQTVNITEEADMTQLVDLVMTDGLMSQVGQEVIHIVRAGRNRRDTAAREGDLGSRRELIYQIRVSCPLAFCQNLNQIILTVIIEMVHAVGIVPEDTEIICGRLQTGEPAYGLIRIGDALRVGVLRYAPDTLDSRIGTDKVFHHVHIRTGRGHRNRNHLDSEVFRNLEVTVITGNRAEELHLRELAPGSVAHDAVCPCTADRVKHDIQRRVSVDDDILRIVFHHIAKQLPCFTDAAEGTVVPAVCSVFTGQVVRGTQDIHHTHGKIELILTRFAAAHIQMDTECLDFVVLLLQTGELFLQLVCGHLAIRFHFCTSVLYGS